MKITQTNKNRMIKVLVFFFAISAFSSLLIYAFSKNMVYFYTPSQVINKEAPINKFITKQSLPVHVGITGPLKLSRLIKFANIVGAKNSINFLKSNASKALDLLRPSDPNDLINKIKGSTNNFHIYTFGGLKETNRWLENNNYA